MKGTASAPFLSHDSRSSTNNLTVTTDWISVVDHRPTRLDAKQRTWLNTSSGRSVRRQVVGGGERSSFRSRWSRRRQGIDPAQAAQVSKWGKTGGVLALLNPVSWSAFTGARESRVSRRSGWSGGNRSSRRSNERRVSPEEANQPHQGEVVKIASKLDSVDSGYNSILDDLGALAEARKALEQTSGKGLNEEKSKS